MAKNFNLKDELLKEGFRIDVEQDVFGGSIISKVFTQEVEVVWYGKQERSLIVTVRFSQDEQNVRVTYSTGRTIFKTKDHLNEKRALNAIHQTIANQGF